MKRFLRCLLSLFAFALVVMGGFGCAEKQEGWYDSTKSASDRDNERVRALMNQGVSQGDAEHHVWMENSAWATEGRDKPATTSKEELQNTLKQP